MEYLKFNGDNPISELINGRVNAMNINNNYKISSNTKALFKKELKLGLNKKIYYKKLKSVLNKKIKDLKFQINKRILKIKL